ncbi:MAG: hypothetical protein IKN38_10625 [Clostridia bacterium]|nr:hypothetical protein [Clostridia bacterium]
MASGYFESSTGTNLEIGVEWSSVASASDNTSTVNVNVYLKHYSIYCAALSGSYVALDGQTKGFSCGINVPENTLKKTYIASKSFTVSHGADGSKSCTLSAGWVFNGTYNGTYIGTLSASSVITLDKIARASSFTAASTLTLCSASTVTVSAASASYKHKVVLRVGNASYSTGLLSGSALRITPPASLADGAVNSSRPSGTVSVETYSGQTKIGTVTKNCTYVIPQSAEFAPSFSLSVTPSSTSAFLTSNGLIAAKLSSIALSVGGVTYRHGASLGSYSITFGARKSSSSSMSLSNLEAGTYSYKAVVKDTRGLSGEASGTVTVLPYFAPYAENVSVFRCDANGDADDAGSFISARATVRFAPLSAKNEADMKLRVLTVSGALVGEWPLSSGQRSVIDAGLSSFSSYKAIVCVSDRAEGSGEHKSVIPTSKVDVHLKNGRLRIGGYVERSGVECDWDARFNGAVSIGDDTVADVVTSRGTSGIWTWKKYASGECECYGRTQALTYSMASAYGTLSMNSDNVQNGVNYPSGLFVSAPCVVAQSSGASSAVIVVPRSSGTLSRTPDYAVISCMTSSGTVDTALDFICRGRWKN